MKNPWISYIAIRVGLFVGILAIMLALQFDPYFAAIISAVISLSISLIFFNKHRSALSEAIYKRTQQKHDTDTRAEDGGADETETKPKAK